MPFVLLLSLTLVAVVVVVCVWALKRDYR